MIKKLMEQQSRKANLRFVTVYIQVSAVFVISVSVNVIKSGLSFADFTIAVNHNDCDIDYDLLYFIRIPRLKLWCCENIAIY